MKELEDIFRKTIEDQKLSSGERKALLSTLKEKNLNEGQLHVLRSQVFNIAKDQLKSYSAIQVLEWIEGANKLLVKYTSEKFVPTQQKVFFSPGYECRDAIIAQLRKAKKEILICVFTISDDVIAKEIVFAHKRFIDVRVITDDDKTEDKGSDIEMLARNGIKVKIDSTPNHMHHKFALIDNKVALTGSYNWTRSAAKYNHENILLTSDKQIIQGYKNEFEKLWDEFVLFPS